ncbi:sensor histidine kinase [Nonomuraea mangrovi]|uniref:histidine kinase n=2 Tax=Nonomuraea mangrovi TaxID=2316207 RepID=A0ABW4T9S3_9ACTN
MVTRERRPVRRLWESMSAAASRAARMGDMPAVLMLVWAGWLAVPLSLSGLAQARAAAAAAYEHDTPPPAPAAGRHDMPTGPDAFTGPDAAPRPARYHPWAGSVGEWAAKGAAPAAALWQSSLQAGAVPADSGAAASALAEELLARERSRIAGEVHDAAGHGFSTIAMQAGLALLVLEEDPEQARESLRAIRETSMEALARLRGALDLMDPRGADDRLPGLVGGVRAAGLPVDMEPADPDVPAHLRGAVYGVVRESLTNVIRHAGPTRALVKVTGERDALVLEVADRGRGPAAAGEGRGLSGMRERVLAAGGEFRAGPRDGGGFQVVARFPLDSA